MSKITEERIKGINRREFITGGVLALTSGKVLLDMLSDNVENKVVRDIYNKLPEHNHVFEASGKVNNVERKRKGMGYIIDRHLYTCAHILDLGVSYIPSPFGMVKISIPTTDPKASLYGVGLEEKVLDLETDRAIFKLPDFMNIPDFPCQPRERYELGEEVFVIGNPILGGKIVRRTRICDLDGFNSEHPKHKEAVTNTKDCFGVNLEIIGGSSGSPVVSLDYKVLGTAASIIGKSLGYVKKIKNYREDLEKANTPKKENSWSR